MGYRGERAACGLSGTGSFGAGWRGMGRSVLYVSVIPQGKTRQMGAGKAVGMHGYGTGWSRLWVGCRATGSGTGSW